MKLFSIFQKEKKEVAVRYQIGWWAFQDLLKIHTFDVSIIKSHLNVMNSKSLIKYTVTGVLKQRSGYMPFIRFVHHSEHILKSENVFNEDENNSLDAQIKITPIVGLRTNKENRFDDISFAFTNQYVVSSLHWGDNFIDFSCGAIHQKICLKQRK